MFDIESEIRTWQNYLRSRGNFRESDLQELEAHLRDEMEDLCRTGLSQDEAFFIAVKRLGNTGSLSREFAKGRTALLWKQLFVEDADEASRRRTAFELVLVAALGLAAGFFAKIPELMGYDPQGPDGPVFFRNISFFLIPSVAAYFVWKHRPPVRMIGTVAAVFLVPLVLVNLFPFTAGSHTEVLTAIHLPLLLMLAAGALYAGNSWRSAERRMDYIRLTGETFVYGVLILLGGGVLTAFTAFLFSSIGFEQGVERFIERYLIVFGAAAIPVAAVFLAETKRSIVESFAPVLARVFAPLFVLLLTVFLAVSLSGGIAPFGEREYLIGFDLLLALVLAMVLYITASRPAGKETGAFDWLMLALIVLALVTNGAALAAVASRIMTYGGSPNKLAALGENVFLTINLGALAYLKLRFLLNKGEFASLVRFQTRYLAVYAVWFAVVALLFPVLFGWA